MELTKPKYRIRCEFGVCKNFANKTIKHSRLGIGCALNICDECSKALFELLKREFKEMKKAEVTEVAETVEIVEAKKKKQNRF